MSEMPERIWAYKGDGENAAEWFWVDSHLDEATEYFRADLSPIIVKTDQVGPMPWRLQIAHEYMLKSMQCIHVGGQTQTTSLNEETTLAMADALIAEHERTKP